MKIPIEQSDDRNRGSLPHIRAVIDRLALMRGTTCQACGRGDATFLIDTRRAPRGVCQRCADEWRAVDPLDRMRLTSAYVQRGRA